MKAEQILQKSAKNNMKRWELNTFKITHPTLYKTIIEAINEAINYTRCCEELCDEERCSYTLNNDSKMCDDCGKVFD